MKSTTPILLLVVAFIWGAVVAAEPSVRLCGQVVDADSGENLPCRMYLQGADGAWHFPTVEGGGTAVTYKRQRKDNPRSVEMHTSLPAKPFCIDLPPGKYTLTVERGKEYLPLTREVVLAKEAVRLRLPLKRWINMAERGWYSGDTHVHRSMEELPTAMLAEDLNVAFPLLYWVNRAFQTPKESPRKPKRDLDPRPIPVDATHVIYPRNTEYEIFTVRDKPHTLGAFLALNHQTVFDVGVPPVKGIAQRIHKEGGLIDFDKHNWPWSMMLAPVIKPDLFELTNNHVWRTEFAFTGYGEPAPAYMKVERDKNGWTEAGWIDYGFQNYYALLNCGFRIRPSGGTASGVHPVPLGFGRVYVHLPEDFRYDAWVAGLNAGRSFVTTGPMLTVEADGKKSGHVFKTDANVKLRLSGVALSEQPLERLEIVINGDKVVPIPTQNKKARKGGYESPLDEVAVEITESSWFVVRCYESRPGGRVRFAHTAPWYVEIAGKPLRPRKAEVEFLCERVEQQLRRNTDVLPEAALAEYRETLLAYRNLLKDAR